MIIPSYINDPVPSPSLQSSFSDMPDEVIMLIINTFIIENGMKFLDGDVLIICLMEARTRLLRS